VQGQDDLPIVALPSRGVAALEEDVVEFVESRFKVQVQDTGFRVQGSTCRVEGLR